MTLSETCRIICVAHLLMYIHSNCSAFVVNTFIATSYVRITGHFAMTQNNTCWLLVYKKNKQVFNLSLENTSIVVFLIYYTFDVDLMEFCMFTLGTILYKKVVPAM